MASNLRYYWGRGSQQLIGRLLFRFSSRWISWSVQNSTPSQELRRHHCRPYHPGNKNVIREDLRTRPEEAHVNHMYTFDDFWLLVQRDVFFVVSLSVVHMQVFNTVRMQVFNPMDFWSVQTQVALLELCPRRRCPC